MFVRSVVRVCTTLLLLIFYHHSISQTSFTEKISDWKKIFPKEDIVAASYKEIINFTLDPLAGPGASKVKASVTNQITLVPVKDYLPYEDGLFYFDEMSIDQLKVNTAEGKEIKFEKSCGTYREENIFHSDAKICIIKFPLGERGKPVTYSFTNNYRDIKFLTSFYFHDRLPAVERIVQFNIPSWMDIDLREFNFTGHGIERTSVKEGDITRVTFLLRNAPAYVSEPASPNHAISYPHVISVNKAYTDNGVRTVLFENVKDLYGWYHQVTSDIGNKPEELKGKVQELTADKKTDIEKVESIFYWVQDHIRYIAFEDGIMGFKPDAAQNVFKNKYGDCKGKANLLKEMLKLAGFDARLTWIGTADLPYDYTLPSLCVDNHMICTVILNGKRYFLDGTESHIALNDYAARIQGKQVLIEDGKNYIIDKIPLAPAEKNKKVKQTKLTIADDMITGSSSIEFNGESKIMIQSIHASIRNDNKMELLSNYLKNGNGNVEVSNIKNSDFSDRQKPLKLDFEFKVANQVTRAGNEVYVIMDWDKDFSGYEIPGERKNDYEFNQKYYYSTHTELAIPAGHKVDYLPAPFKKSTADFSFEGSYSNNGKSIIYKKTIVVNKPILKKSGFSEWNAFIADINKFYNDQVVLVK